MAAFYNQATLTYNNTTVSSNIVTGEIIEVLTAAKTAVSDAYSPGEILTYAVSLVNSGCADQTVTVTDDLGAYTDAGQTLVPLTYTDGSVKLFVNGVLQAAPTAAAGSDSLVFSNITVPADGNAVIVYQAAANGFAPAESGSEIVNTVTITGAGSPVTAQATVPAENEAILSISKSLTPAEVAENGQITYTFIVQNTGNTPADTPIINDTFDPVLNDITVIINGTAAPQLAYTYSETTGEFASTAGAFTVPAATFARDARTGAYTAVPGTAVISVTGTI